MSPHCFWSEAAWNQQQAKQAISCLGQDIFVKKIHARFEMYEFKGSPTWMKPQEALTNYLQPRCTTPRIVGFIWYCGLAWSEERESWSRFDWSCCSQCPISTSTEEKWRTVVSVRVCFLIWRHWKRDRILEHLEMQRQENYHWIFTAVYPDANFILLASCDDWRHFCLEFNFYI